MSRVRFTFCKKKPKYKSDGGPFTFANENVSRMTLHLVYNFFSLDGGLSDSVFCFLKRQNVILVIFYKGNFDLLKTYGGAERGYYSAERIRLSLIPSPHHLL